MLAVEVYLQHCFLKHYQSNLAITKGINSVDTISVDCSKTRSDLPQHLFCTVV
jgi:hypothetical protein